MFVIIILVRYMRISGILDLFPAQLAIFPWSLWVEKMPIRSHSNVVITGCFFQRLCFQDNLDA